MIPTSRAVYRAIIGRVGQIFMYSMHVLPEEFLFEIECFDNRFQKKFVG